MPNASMRTAHGPRVSIPALRYGATVVPLADAVRALLLDQRDTLPHAANGKPVAPSCPYAAETRKKISHERATPVRQLVAVDLTDLADGVPLARVAAKYHRLLAGYAAFAAAHRGPTRSLTALMRSEERSNLTLNLAEFALSEALNGPVPTQVAALEAVVREADEQITRTLALRDGAERELARLRTTTPVPPSCAKPARRYLTLT